MDMIKDIKYYLVNKNNLKIYLYIDEGDFNIEYVKDISGNKVERGNGFVSLDNILYVYKTMDSNELLSFLLYKYNNNENSFKLIDKELKKYGLELNIDEWEEYN